MKEAPLKAEGSKLPLDMRILLVDDFEMIRRMFTAELKKMGFTRIDQAVNGLEAIAKLHESVSSGDPFKFVFCDWNMPEKSGLDVLVECRKTESLEKIPFVMVTAESEHVKVVQALKAGANDYIIKPVSGVILQKKIMKLLGVSNG